MSLAITHFAVGASLTILVVAIISPRTELRMILGVLGGLWALIPDFHYVIPGSGGPLEGLKHMVIGNVFWFHTSLDSLVQGRGSRKTAALALLFLLLVVAATELANR